MSLVHALDLERVYGVGPGAVTALGGVTISLDRGRLTALRGRSGSGKTTLINLLGGLDRPTGGKVLFDGIELSALAEPHQGECRATPASSRHEGHGAQRAR
jgi:putative ABC transport system ATP-binding protein